MTSPAALITSRDNALVKELRRLSQDNTAYRKTGRIWVEGEHLGSAALQRGVRPAVLVFAQSQGDRVPVALQLAARQVVCVPDALFAEFSGLESPAGIGLVIDLPAEARAQPALATVVLDRVQDAGNVGSILRSAAAFGFGQVLALKGTAALWSPKVLRAGMGAHFGLRLVEFAEVSDVAALELPVVVTSSHQGELIQKLRLPHPCAWVMGHEGQGVREDLMALAAVHVRIDQPGGEESLNVAAAAAICLHASSLQMA